ncbi:MAG: hypothetical protein JWM21_3077 [Acidobacteria bacterium]|nr:hypothetical protein [Acidobacteriota bacterium]
MSQQPPPNYEPFVPPPPPSSGSSLYSPEVLGAKAAEVARNAKNALILSIVGLFCFGFIFGFLAFRKANEALETIEIYDVARDKRGLATAAKVIGIVDIVLWGIGLLMRIFLR